MSLSAFDKAVQHAREMAMLECISAAIEWDERTYMPTNAGPYSAQQLTLLAGMLHQRRTDPQYGEWLDMAAEEVGDGEPHGDHASTVRILTRDFQKATKLPQSLVEALAKNGIEGQQAWVEARKAREFDQLRPYLEKTVQLKRDEAQALGFDECMYDALLDKYEPEEKTSRVRAVFSSLRDQLVVLLKQIADSQRKPSTEVLTRSYPIDRQRSFGTHAAKQIGFCFDSGRLDVTNHPFCTTLGPRDIRLTTRYDEHFFPSAFFGTLHESGHGIYEQGLRTEMFGLPPGKFCSMAIHESQSRLWENLVGRSEAFWKYFFPLAQARFPEALAEVGQTEFLHALNCVTPSLIRVEADEVTYNLHIIVRFELEQEIINGELTIGDLPEAWNQRYEDFLGVKPQHDGDGVLQDVHWSTCDIGYFPTYALGNLYAAQFFDQAEQELGSLEESFQRGEFQPLRGWLREKIHRHGQCYSAAELVEQVTGKPLSDQPLVSRLRDKLQTVYDI